MKITFRIIMIGVAVLGLGFGASFGAGIAYGRSTPKTAASTPTQQQLNTSLGVSGAGTGGAAQASGTTTAGAGQQRGGGAAAGAAVQALARNASGRVTAVDGRSLTIETAQGSQKVNLSANGTVQKYTTGAMSDLKVGDTVIASGTRNADGSFDASSLTQVTQDLASLASLIGSLGTQTQATPTGR